MIRALALCMAVALPAAAQSPLPFDLGGPFALIDQTGQPRSEADPDGHAQLLFFGYANCPGICATAMPMMADVTDALAERGLTVRPVMITVDPERDTVASMGAPLARLHPEFVGLTGDKAALAAAYREFSVERTLAFVDPQYGPVYSHGSFIYLLDAEGRVLTLFPPVLDGKHAADVVAGYLDPQG